jgi:lactoylglutathione lyase
VAVVSDDAGAAPAAAPSPTPAVARVEHVALWTTDLARACAFWERHFGARAGGRYVSANTPGLETHFVVLPGGGARLELMRRPALADAAPAPAVGWAHVALTVGDEAAVDALTARLAAAGVRVVSAPRVTGDGYYESVVADPEGNRIELVAG